MSSIPLSIPVLLGNELKYCSECIQTGWVSTAGQFVNRFENNFASWIGAKEAVSCVNGTAALHISLLLANIGHDDMVFVPTITFIAPVNAVRYVGAEPIFIDCDDYLNIDCEKIEEFIQNYCRFDGKNLFCKKNKKKIKGMIPVHVFGNMADMKKLCSLARKYNLKIIEDATEALGSYLTLGKFKGKKAGTIGDFGCFSFNGNKIITTGGGGMIVATKEKDTRKAHYLTTQAKNDEVRYIHNEIGYNYRLTNLQAAMGCAQLEQLDRYIDIKRKNYVKYKNLLKDTEGLRLIEEPDYCQSNFWFYSLMVDKTKYKENIWHIIKRLQNAGIQVRPLWWPNHLQKPYKDYMKSEMIKAIHYHESVINLPCSVNLTDSQILTVSKYLKKN
jgi:perosamine synthetase